MSGQETGRLDAESPDGDALECRTTGGMRIDTQSYKLCSPEDAARNFERLLLFAVAKAKIYADSNLLDAASSVRAPGYFLKIAEDLSSYKVLRDKEIIWTWVLLAAAAPLEDLPAGIPAQDTMKIVAALLLSRRLSCLMHELALDDAGAICLQDNAHLWSDLADRQIMLSGSRYVGFDSSSQLGLSGLLGRVRMRQVPPAPPAPVSPAPPAVHALAARLEPSPITKSDSGTRNAHVKPDGKSMVVADAIGAGNGNADDIQFVSAWNFLTKPLGLAGGIEPRMLETILRLEFPWMGNVIDAIVGDLKLRQSAGLVWARWRPLLMVGPPGSGKTRLARRVAELMKLGFGEVNAGGSSDNRLLQGTARGWNGASPTYVLHVMRRSMTANPVILVDEIDKPNPDGRNGDIRNTLLTMLEPLSAKAWPDEALVAPVDLSAVNWLLAANDASPLRGPLLTRLRVVDAPAPRPEHIPVVLKSMRRDLAAELGVRENDLPPLETEIERALVRAAQKGISLRRVRAAYETALNVGWERAVSRVTH